MSQSYRGFPSREGPEESQPVAFVKPALHGKAGFNVHERRIRQGVQKKDRSESNGEEKEKSYTGSGGRHCPVRDIHSDYHQDRKSTRLNSSHRL